MQVAKGQSSAATPRKPSGDPSDPDHWLKLLVSHLSDKSKQATVRCTDIATLAQREYHHELVSQLAQKGRWDDAVRLARAMIQKHWRPEAKAVPPTATISPWSHNATSLTAALQAPIRLDSMAISPHDQPLGEPAMSKGGRAILRHLWYTVGDLIITDSYANENINPGILRIIAVFHEAGFMPASVYQQSHDENHQTGPVPSVFSSHIFNALSEAALPTPAGSTSLMSSRKVYEALGSPSAYSSFHFRPSGLRHGVWLEVILWACIKGGWIMQGSRLLRRIVYEEGQWLECKDNSRPRGIDPSRLDQRLLALYADENLEIIRDVNHDRRRQRHACVGTCWDIRYLQGLALQQSLAYAWSSKVLAILEHSDLDIDRDPYLAERFLDLALRDWHRTELDSHATTVMFRQAFAILQAHTSKGNLLGAFRVFRKVLRRTDENKQLALQQFFAALEIADGGHAQQNGVDDTLVGENCIVKKTVEASREGTALTTNTTEQDRSAMYPTMPTALLARFMNLITEVRAFSFGRWMLYSDPPDEPIIPRHLYGDYHLVPALVRFAAKAQDPGLLDSVLDAVKSTEIDKEIPLHWRLAILESLVELKNWTGAKVALEQYMTQPQRPKMFDGYAMSLLVRSALLLDQDSSGPAWMMATRLAHKSNSPEAIKTVLAITGTSCDKWTQSTLKLMETLCLPASWPASLSQAAFVLLLEGVVHANGPKAGRDIIDLLCRDRTIHDHKRLGSSQQGQFATSDAWLTCETKDGQMQLRPRGTFLPNASAIRIAQASADTRAKDRDLPNSTSSMDTWGLDYLARLGFSRAHSREALEGKYSIPGSTALQDRVQNEHSISRDLSHRELFQGRSKEPAESLRLPQGEGSMIRIRKILVTDASVN